MHHGDHDLPGVRLAARLLVATTLLLLGVGGLVTTYRVGMAVHDWPTTFGSTMFAYPLDEMLRSWGVTLEHGHRMLGSVVGLLTLALLIVAARAGGRGAFTVVLLGLALEVGAVLLLAGQRASSTGEVLIDWSRPALPFAGAVVALVASTFIGERRGLRAMTVAGHLAVVGQGLLGGTRVLENSTHLAFLHGSLAQVVFTVLAVTATVVGSARAEARHGAGTPQRGPVVLAALAAVLVLGQSTLGAWTRHTGGHLPLGLHGMNALVVLGVVLLLVSRLGAFERATGSPVVGRVRRGLLHLVAAQFVLGVGVLVVILAVAGGFEGPVTVTEAVTSTLHVLLGALLAGSCARAAVVLAAVAPAGARAQAGKVSQAPEAALSAGGVA